MNLKIALAGNPNCGKTTLFNALTGSNQFVGNWPGVTVEKKEGRLKRHEGVTITDLPGIYSLSPYTLEEVVARNYLIDEKPDVILNIIDGTNLERNLYLTTQLIELGIPVVVAVNMMDKVNKNGDKINIEEMTRHLGCKVMEISALKGTGIETLAEEAVNAAGKTDNIPMHIFSGPVEHAIAHIEEGTVHNLPKNKQRWYAIKIFERDKKILSKLDIDLSVLSHIEQDIKDAERELDDDAESIITNERYVYIASIIKSCYKKKNINKLTLSDKIDKIVTNRIAAFPIFIIVMSIVYYVSVSTVGAVVTDWTNDQLFGDGWNLFGIWVPGIPAIVEMGLDAAGTPIWLNGLIIDGIIGGVGAVLGFVPQMMMLFIFLGFLESCGYLARVAFVMDRIFRKFGLSGKSFIPLFVGSGCGVPGIMASRIIENERDRRMTIMTTTFIPCGAKLPIIALIATALFEDAWWIGPSAYVLGIASVIISGIILKKSKMFSGEPAPFVMELPEYHLPTIGNILHSMWERSSSFIKRAGTVIMLSSIIIWAGSVFGNVGGSFGFDPEMELENSILGYIGNAVKWIFVPLGFGSIKAVIATIMGLVAKEEVVGVFGVLDFEGMTQLAAYSFLVFNLLCAPCFAAMGAIRREMNSAKWTGFAIGYQCVFAYAAAFLIYQFGLLFTGSANLVGLLLAIVLAAGIVYLMVKPYNKKSYKRPAVVTDF